MKILFMGDYSNLHACVGSELRRRGHEVCVVSDGGRYMDTRRDIQLARQPGLRGTLKYLYDVCNVIPKLKGYDVVQIVNPHFLVLRPGRIKYFFDMLKRNNGSVFLTLAGNDYNFVEMCLKGEMFRFSEFKVGKEDTEFERLTHHGELWTKPSLKSYNDYLYANIDGAMSVLPEYDMAVRPLLGEKIAFTNIPVDLSYLPFSPLAIDGPVTLFLGMRSGMEVQKGTRRLLIMCKELEKEMPGRCRVVNVRNLPLKDYLARMAESHIVLDQLYSYSPGTNGFQAMALGKVAATGGQPEFYSYLGEDFSRPIIPLSPLKDWKEYFRQLILNPEPLVEMGANGRRLVEKHNDVRVVADKFESHWYNIL